MTIVEKIVAIANGDIGQREIPGNKGFVNNIFHKLMIAMGWLKGQAWCTYYAESVWYRAYEGLPAMQAEISKRFSGSAVTTFRNFKEGVIFKTGKEPRVGAVVIWRMGNGWQGHAGIVVQVNADGSFSFSSVEGNTNAAGGREGIEVARKYRRTGEPFKANGLNIEGFIYPI